jgi:adenylate cyclase
MARQALVIGVNDPSVLDLAGVAISNFTGDTSTALAALDRAITLNPNFAAAFGHRSMILGFINQPDEAILSAHQAIRLSPLDPVTFAFCNALALAHLIADQYEEGLIWADRAARENSGLPALRLKLSLCGYLGRRKEVNDCLQRVREIYSRPSVAALIDDFPRGLAPEVAACIGTGWRKAGLPEL